VLPEIKITGADLLIPEPLYLRPSAICNLTYLIGV
jgi:hypothetical protein